MNIDSKQTKTFIFYFGMKDLEGLELLEKIRLSVNK